MSSPTLYLNLLILIATVFPSGFGSSLGSLLKRKRETVDVTALFFNLLPYLILLPAIFILKKELFFFQFPTAVFYFTALVFAPFCLLLEYISGIIFIYFTTGKRYKGMTLHAAWKGKPSAVYLLLTALIAVGEEFIYRQVWFAILAGTFHLPVIVIVLIASLFYGLNHLYFGLNSVLAKFISGCVYGGLYVTSGYSIFVAMITHVLQNFVLIFMTRRKNA